MYRKGTWITFGGVSYLHIFTLLVGIYLVNMMKETLKRVPEETGNRLRITQMPGSIMQGPSRIATPGLLLKKGFGMGMVFQSTGDSFELVGNHEKPGITTIQIPWMDVITGSWPPGLAERSPYVVSLFSTSHPAVALALVPKAVS